MKFLKARACFGFVLLSLLSTPSHAQIEAIAYLASKAYQASASVKSAKDLKSFDLFSFHQTFVGYEGYRYLDDSILGSDVFLKRLLDVRYNANWVPISWSGVYKVIDLALEAQQRVKSRKKRPKPSVTVEQVAEELTEDARQYLSRPQEHRKAIMDSRLLNGVEDLALYDDIKFYKTFIQYGTYKDMHPDILLSGEFSRRLQRAQSRSMELDLDLDHFKAVANFLDVARVRDCRFIY